MSLGTGECRKLRSTRLRDASLESAWHCTRHPDRAWSKRGDYVMLPEGLATGAVRGPDCAWSVRGDHAYPQIGKPEYWEGI